MSETQTLLSRRGMVLPSLGTVARCLCIQLSGLPFVVKMIFVTMGFERKTSGRKTKALAPSKRVPQLFSAIASSYVVVFQAGARLNMLPNHLFCMLLKFKKKMNIMFNQKISQ